MKRVLHTGAALAAVTMTAAGPTTPVFAAHGDGAPPATVSAKQTGKPIRASGGPITLGEMRSGNLRRGQHDYVLEARAGQRVQIALTSDDFDTVLRITGPDGFVLENDDGPDGTLDSLIRALLPAAGQYRVSVTSFDDTGSGEYRLATLDPANPLPEGTQARGITIGQRVSGLLAQSDARRMAGQNVDYYRFNGQQGQRITLDMESARLDTVLTVYLPDGQIEENDDRQGPQDSNSRLSLSLPMDGTYIIAASSYAQGEIGEYALTLAQAAPDVRTVRPASGTARVFALSVGVAHYERISPLNRTDEDARRISHALRDAGVLAPASVTLINAEATHDNFRNALAHLAGQVGPDDTLLIFFSGHGEKVENTSTERDGSAETIELFDAPLFDHELARMMDGVTARTLLVIDACFAGGFDQVIDQADNRMGIFSSDADTLSLVAQGEKSGGYISHIFRRALEGEADANGDGAMEAGELSEFMRREFYTMVLAEPLSTEAEDFRDHQVPGFQHIIVDRGGDGMPFQQVLLNYGSASGTALAPRD